MSQLVYIVASTAIVSLVSLVGIVTLSVTDRALQRVLQPLVALSAGALLGGALLHLLPEAVELICNTIEVYATVLIGFSMFFFLEKFIQWHHHHGSAKEHKKNKISPVSYLVLVSDVIHNFVDGLIIAASYLVSIPLGVITTGATILHEIPQEIGDFALLIHGGMSKIRALRVNFFTALSSVVGGLVGFYFAGTIGNSFALLLPLAAGHFIYIAATDLMPELAKEGFKEGMQHSAFFITGLVIMYLLTLI